MWRVTFRSNILGYPYQIERFLGLFGYRITIAGLSRRDFWTWWDAMDYLYLVTTKNKKEY